MRTGVVDFNVEHIKPVQVAAAPELADRDWMSRYVWGEDGGFSMLVRVAPKNFIEARCTGAIYFGRSKDGVSFDLEGEPVLAPGPDAHWRLRGSDAGEVEQ